MSAQWVVFVGDDIWHVGITCEDGARVKEVAFEPQTPLESRAGTLRQHLDESGYSGEAVVLALPSSWCLCASISTEGLERRGRRREMGFRLEEHLPVSIEDLVADYVEVGAGVALGVCSEVERLASLVGAVEGAGIAVGPAVPGAFLVAGQALNGEPDTGMVVVAMPEHEHEEARIEYDLVELSEGRPVAWWWFADDEQGAREQLRRWAKAHETPVSVATVGAAEWARQEGLLGACVEVTEASGRRAREAAVLQAAALLEGSASLWVDLRRDALAATGRGKTYRTPMAVVAGSLAVLMVCVAAVTHWRGSQYDGLRAECRREETRVFRKALPGQRLPDKVSIMERLLSEGQKLTDQSRSFCALAHLHGVLSNLPGNLRYRILDLNIEPDLIRLRGQATSQAIAEAVAAALRQSGGYEVEPLQWNTVRPGVVSFSLVVRARSGPEGVKEAAS